VGFLGYVAPPSNHVIGNKTNVLMEYAQDKTTLICPIGVCYEITYGYYFFIRKESFIHCMCTSNFHVEEPVLVLLAKYSFLVKSYNHTYVNSFCNML